MLPHRQANGASNYTKTLNPLHNIMRLEIIVPPFLRYSLISLANDFFWRGPSKILMIFLQVVEVGWLLSQFWSVFDNFTWWESFVVYKPSRVLSSTPSKPPISYHLEETEDRNSNRTCFFGSESVTKYRIYHIFISLVQLL